MKRVIILLAALLLLASCAFGCAKKESVSVDLSGKDLVAATEEPVQEKEEQPAAPTPGIDPTPAPELPHEKAEVVTEGDYTVQTYLDGTCDIIEYTGAGEDLVIPSVIAGCRVIAIGESVFKGNQDITSLVLPEGLRTVGGFMCKGCSNLHSVTFPEGLETIEHCAFPGCALADVVLPGSVKTIGAWAFFGTPWEDALLDTEDAWVSLGDGACWIYNGKDTSVTVPAEYKIFEFLGNEKIKEIVLSEGLETVPPYACEALMALQSVTFPSTLVSIGECGFRNARALPGFDLSGTQLVSIGLNAFQDCLKLRECKFPASLTDIDETAFDGCRSVVFLCPEDSPAMQYAVDHELSRASKW